MREKVERKTRSDKKREIKALVHLQLYETLNRLSYITKLPLKTVGEHLCKEGLLSYQVIEGLSPSFRRSFVFKDDPNQQQVFHGNPQQKPWKLDRGEGARGNISMRFLYPEYERISELAYAMDQSVSSASAILLEAAVKNNKIVNTLLKERIDLYLDSSRQRQLKNVLRYINANSVSEERITITQLLHHLAGQFQKGTKPIQQVIREWLDEWDDGE